MILSYVELALSIYDFNLGILIMSSDRVWDFNSWKDIRHETLSYILPLTDD